MHSEIKLRMLAANKEYFAMKNDLNPNYFLWNKNQYYTQVISDQLYPMNVKRDRLQMVM